MTTDPTIEPATQADLEAITGLWVRLARGQREHGSFVLAEANRKTMHETLAAHAHANGLLVARVEGAIVGFVSYSIEHGTLALDAPRGIVSNIYVEPAYRGKGVGTALLDASEAALADQGAAVVILEVMTDNVDARQFYEHHAYESYRTAMKRSLAPRSESDTHSKEDG
jgi:ribosomal protein S18 acetylase RimI-like enzyme